MDTERALISKIVSTGQLQDAISKGIRADLFADDDMRNMFLYLMDHARKYRTTPSMSVVKDEKPSFEWLHIEEPLDYVIDKFIVLVKRRLGNEYVLELARALDDPGRAENIDIEFLEASRKLATTVPTTKMARFKDMEQRIAEYERKKEAGEKTGLPFGFPTLDLWTGGLQPHEFCTISAFSGVGKSTLLQVIAFNMYVAGKTPLYISLEMEASALLRKFDAMAAALDYKKMKQLDLDAEHMERWQEHAQAVKSVMHDIPIIDSIRHCTPDHVYAETVRHMPDVVMVDYIGLMKSSVANRNANLWQTIGEITQDLKQNARTLGIPIIAAAQTNRSGAKDGAELDNIGSSISIVQDSDIVLGLFQDDTMKDEKTMELRLRKNRDGRLGEFRIQWDYENLNFRERGMREAYSRALSTKPEPEPVANAVTPEQFKRTAPAINKPRPRPSR